MFKKIGVVLYVSILYVCSTVTYASPWGANYFPNTELITHEGKKVRFFDDLIKDKIVAINFMYTHCAEACPLETAQLIRVQKILGDKLGTDIHFYSISINPELDSPEVLNEYRQRFGAKWTFLTGNEQDIIHLRRKLGLYIEGVAEGDNKKNHNVSMIIGNQRTGRWMKRSPFENPYVLADQLSNWLSGWKSAQPKQRYATAPELRPLSTGESLFRTRCASCHTIDGKQQAQALGPDLLGITQRRELTWLVNWLRAPDKMIADKDPIALSLLNQYNGVLMPNLSLSQQDVNNLLHYLQDAKQQ